MNTIEIKGDGELVLVDDDPHFHMIFEFIYKRYSKLSNPLIGLHSGEECIEYLQKSLDEGTELPALIMMDVNMSGNSGIETLSHVRNELNCSKLPAIIMLSSSNFQRDIDESYEAGATAYIEKPFNLDDIVITKAA